MRGGWVPFPRAWADDPELFRPKPWLLWSWLTFRAAHSAHTVSVGLQTICLEPGQLLFGRQAAARETGLTEGEIRSTINRLAKRQQIAVKTTNKFSLITIAGWPFAGEATAETTGKTTGKTPSKRPAERHKGELKKTKNEEKKNPPPQGGEGERASDFESFWNLYPKREGRKAALKAWMTIAAPRPSMEDILRSLVCWRVCAQWQRENGRFVPRAARWLEERSWEDSPAPGQPDESRPMSPAARMAQTRGDMIASLMNGGDGGFGTVGEGLGDALRIDVTPGEVEP